MTTIQISLTVYDGDNSQQCYIYWTKTTKKKVCHDTAYRIFTYVALSLDDIFILIPVGSYFPRDTKIE